MRCESVNVVTRGRAQQPVQVLACQICGCTEDHACEGGCYWVSLDPPICSAHQEAGADLETIPAGGLFNAQRCPASRTPALHTPIWLDEISGYCARCHQGFLT